MVDFDPTHGHEQAGCRPALIISDDMFNQSRAGLVFAVPMTTQARGIPTHVDVSPPEGGVRAASFLKCEDLRSISVDRLVDAPWGAVSARTLERVESVLRILLSL